LPDGLELAVLLAADGVESIIGFGLARCARKWQRT